MRAGIVPVVGRPNVGKSTLVNALVGAKVAITSSRPQTTRNVIRGVVTRLDDRRPSFQLVLLDTPGVHRPRTELGTRLNRLVTATLSDADVIAFVLDATQPIGPGDRLIAGRLREAGTETVVLVNKVDRARPAQVAAQLALAGEWYFGAYVPISALTGRHLDVALEELADRVPEGPALFPADAVTDQSEEALVAEIIREKFLERLRQELPHSLTVVVDEMEGTAGDLVVVRGRAVVERPSQRGIVIGKGGALLQAAGTEARAELEQLLGVRVHLDLRVVVEPDWQRQPQALDRLGF